MCNSQSLLSQKQGAGSVACQQHLQHTAAGSASAASASVSAALDSHLAPFNANAGFSAIFTQILKAAFKQLARADWMSQLAGATHLRRILSIVPPPVSDVLAIEGLAKRVVLLLCTDDEVLLLRELARALVAFSTGTPAQVRVLVNDLRAASVCVRLLSNAAVPEDDELTILLICILTGLANAGADTRDAVLNAKALPPIIARALTTKCKTDARLQCSIGAFLCSILRFEPRPTLEALFIPPPSSSSSSSSPLQQCNVLHVLADLQLYAQGVDALEIACTAWMFFFEPPTDSNEDDSGAIAPIPSPTSAAVKETAARKDRRARVQALLQINNGPNFPVHPTDKKSQFTTLGMLLGGFVALCHPRGKASVVQAAMTILWHVAREARGTSERTLLLNAGALKGALPYILPHVQDAAASPGCPASLPTALLDVRAHAVGALRFLSRDNAGCARLVLDGALPALGAQLTSSTGDFLAWDDALLCAASLARRGDNSMRAELLRVIPVLPCKLLSMMRRRPVAREADATAGSGNEQEEEEGEEEDGIARDEMNPRRWSLHALQALAALLDFSVDLVRAAMAVLVETSNKTKDDAKPAAAAAAAAAVAGTAPEPPFDPRSADLLNLIKVALEQIVIVADAKKNGEENTTATPAPAAAAAVSAAAAASSSSTSSSKKKDSVADLQVALARRLLASHFPPLHGQRDHCFCCHCCLCGHVRGIPQQAKKK
jgi:hypothetical protein